jgi:chemotaxis protein methyltransferase CheR
MTSDEFDQLRATLRDLTGIHLEDDKRYLLEGRLGPVIRRLGIGSISEFAATLAAAPFGPLRPELIEALVTTETSFFRDLHPWEALRTSIIPDLIQRRRNDRKLVIWCGASSTGQEPYSLAMLLRDHFPELSAGWTVTLLATDISRGMLDRARAGLYSRLEVNRGLPAPQLLKHFRQEGLAWRLTDEVRSMVEFRELNLCQPWSIVPACDFILLRNVMIYFEAETKKRILSRIARTLRPDGYLLLGTAETTLNLETSFERVPHLKSGFYRLIGAGP